MINSEILNQIRYFDMILYINCAGGFMKKVYLIGGTMGAGKTATCQLLKKELDRSVFLDGDWCWDMHPFQVNEETKTMVLDNICHMLNNFIHCQSFDHIIFCWVMHEQAIIDEIIQHLDIKDCQVYPISLVLDEESLRKRLQKDVDNHIREQSVIERSVQRIPLYQRLHTVKIDVSHCTIQETVKKIKEL